MHLEKLSEHTLNVPSPNQGAELERNGTGCCDENIIIFGGPPKLLLYKKEPDDRVQFLNRLVVAGALQQNYWLWWHISFLLSSTYVSLYQLHN